MVGRAGSSLFHATDTAHDTCCHSLRGAVQIDLEEKNITADRSQGAKVLSAWRGYGCHQVPDRHPRVASHLNSIQRL
jgi:hypothetical protein